MGGGEAAPPWGCVRHEVSELRAAVVAPLLGWTGLQRLGQAAPVRRNQ